ncbi:hypothetical protein IV203_013970 [Nitzschia inconspicua]|uniref:Uncharacterized protein n=1 Tax=Nitzschia inconspicua TaxID=303405 RepID=A0A9K3Q965_9STRA|nr:hypothetical protein IV203_014249 [Nitzschia inconspicua]KAG7374875.1 hypothetical protein IV203_013970 [Nitzschia inconspicua]
MKVYPPQEEPQSSLQHRPQWLTVMKRFAGHLLVAIGIFGLFFFEWWDERYTSDNPWAMSTVGGIVDPSASPLLRVSNANELWSEEEDRIHDDLPDLNVWVQMDEKEIGAVDHNSSDIEKNVEPIEVIVDGNDRSLMTLSWKWTVVHSDQTPKSIGLITGCPHCGQIDDDDDAFFKKDTANDDTKWKVYRLELLQDTSIYHPYKRRLFPRWYAQPKGYLQDNLCAIFSQEVSKSEKNVGVVEVPVPDSVEREEGVGYAFHALVFRFWNALYDEKDTNADTSTGDKRRLSEVCRLEIVDPERNL